MATRPGRAPAPFPIPNHKDYDRNAEDWALAVVWYLYRKNELLTTWPRRHHDFVEQLFLHEGILP